METRCVFLALYNCRTFTLLFSFLNTAPRIVIIIIHHIHRQYRHKDEIEAAGNHHCDVDDSNDHGLFLWPAHLPQRRQINPLLSMLRSNSTDWWERRSLLRLFWTCVYSCWLIHLQDTDWRLLRHARPSKHVCIDQIHISCLTGVQSHLIWSLECTEEWPFTVYRLFFCTRKSKTNILCNSDRVKVTEVEFQCLKHSVLCLKQVNLSVQNDLIFMFKNSISLFKTINFSVQNCLFLSSELPQSVFKIIYICL